MLMNEGDCSSKEKGQHKSFVKMSQNDLSLHLPGKDFEWPCKWLLSVKSKSRNGTWGGRRAVGLVWKALGFETGDNSWFPISYQQSGFNMFPLTTAKITPLTLTKLFLCRHLIKPVFEGTDRQLIGRQIRKQLFILSLIQIFTYHTDKRTIFASKLWWSRSVKYLKNVLSNTGRWADWQESVFHFHPQSTKVTRYIKVNSIK